MSLGLILDCLSDDSVGVTVTARGKRHWKLWRICWLLEDYWPFERLGSTWIGTSVFTSCGRMIAHIHQKLFINLYHHSWRSKMCRHFRFLASLIWTSFWYIAGVFIFIFSGFFVNLNTVVFFNNSVRERNTSAGLSSYLISKALSKATTVWESIWLSSTGSWIDLLVDGIESIWRWVYTTFEESPRFRVVVRRLL